MKTVLVIDDMAIFREPIAAGLRLAGFKTISAVDGIDGLQAVRTHRPDLVLLDLSMPNLDGMGVLRAIRRDAVSKDVPVILLTALTDIKFIDEADKLAVRDYLLKSRFSMHELVKRINRALEPPETPLRDPPIFEAPSLVYSEDDEAEIAATGT